MYSNSPGGIPALPDFTGAVQGTALHTLHGGQPVHAGQNGHGPAFGIRHAGGGNPGMVTPHGAAPVQNGGSPPLQAFAQPAYRDATSERLWSEYTHARAGLFQPGLSPGMRIVVLMKLRGISHALINEAWAALRPDIARDLMGVALATDEKVAGELRTVLNVEIPAYFEGFVPSGLEAMNEKLRCRSFGGAVLQAGLSGTAWWAPGPQPTSRQDLPAGEAVAVQAESPWQDEFGMEFKEEFKEQAEEESGDEYNNGDSADEYREPAEASGDASIEEPAEDSPGPGRSAVAPERARETAGMNANLLRLKRIRDTLSGARRFDHVALSALLRSRLAFSYEDRQTFAASVIDHFVDALQAKNKGVEVEECNLRDTFIKLLKKMCSFHKLNAKAAKRRREEEGGEPSGKPEMDASNVHLLRCLYANRDLLHMLGKADKKTISQLRRSLGVYVKIEILDMLDKGKIRLSKEQVEHIIVTPFSIQAKAATMIEAARKACPQRGNVEAAETDGEGEPMSSDDSVIDDDLDDDIDADGYDDEY